MNSQQSSWNPDRLRFAPRLEALESRWCPSGARAGTAFVRGDTLIITTGNRDDDVVIRHDGDGDVTVTVDGTPLRNPAHRGDNGHRGNGSHSHSNSGSDSRDDHDDGGSTVFNDVRRIVVRTNGGNDDVDFATTGELTRRLRVDVDLGRGDDTIDFDFSSGVSRRLAVDVHGMEGNDTVGASFGEVDGSDVTFRALLGRGDDRFDATLEGDLIDDARVSFNVQGQAGTDTVDVSALSIDIAEPAVLDLFLAGDGGADEISVDYSGALSGAIILRADGGAGDDTLAANLDLDAGSEGFVAARVRGGAGDDDLTLNILVADDLAFVAGLIDGGAGTDTCEATSNVVTRNCEM